ncbi:MAG: SMI1/KNR4 family protein [Kofleriaceae bacterium]
MKSLDQIISTIADLGGPTTDAQRSRARENVKNLPIELEQFYARADGADVDDVSIFMIDDELIDANRQRTPSLRPFVFFASDGGDGFFAIDTQGKLNRGIGAVFWADRSSSNTRSWIYSARTLGEFLEAVVAGQKPWKAPSLSQVELSEMAAAFAAHRDRWTGGPPLGLAETVAAGRRVNVRFPRELNAVLETANGVEIPAVGVTLYDRDKITAVDGAIANGRTGALWIGEDDIGNRYALSIRDWRGPDGSEVVRVAPGGSAETAPIIGQLAAVVVAWLDRRKP